MAACQDSSKDNEDLENTFKFFPPLYRQRYEKVMDLLVDPKWTDKLTSLVDFGCAEFKLFTLLKRSTNLKQISLVDVDEHLLEDRIMLVNPLPAEFLRRRKYPLKVSVFAGSVTDPDCRLLSHDVVTAIELIEHLYPDELEAFTYNIFQYIAPKIAIITTPNADFNVVFSSDPKRFRHFDHKFEWSREQFEEWAVNVTNRFCDYEVSFIGIGKGPEGSDHLGGCSQMALFLRKDLLNNTYLRHEMFCNCDDSVPSELKCFYGCTSCLWETSYGICTYQNVSKKKYSYKMDNGTEQFQKLYYKCLREVNYPYDDDHRTDGEKLLDEIRYRINNSINYKEPIQIEDIYRYEIPLSHLIKTNEDFLSMEELEILLKKSNFEIEDCINPLTKCAELCVIIPEQDDTSSSCSSDMSSVNNDYGICDSNDLTLTNWDDNEWDRNCEINTCS